MIRTENLVYKYEGRDAPALDAINIEIREGEYVALIGPNGCGKSTLVKHFNALLLPTEGTVRVDGMNTKDSSSVREIRQKVGMIFQNPDNQIVAMTVEEDVSFGPGNLRLPSTEIQRRVYDALEMVGLRKYARRPPHTLSGGEKQLLAVAGVLAMNPKYIILDEPTSSLDPNGQQKVSSVLQKLHKRGITVIHITHNMDEIVRAERVIVMNKGRVLFEGMPAEVFSKIERLKALGLGIPRITELMWRLKKIGLDVRTDILTIDDACAEIASLKNYPGRRYLERGCSRRITRDEEKLC